MKQNFPSPLDCTVAIIGLGYVGLPLAIEFAKTQNCLRTKSLLNRKVIGYDIDVNRLSELRQSLDRTNEISTSQLKQATDLVFTDDPNVLTTADVFIVTVPTPIDAAKRPNFKPLEMASLTVGMALRSRCQSGAETIPVVIYESTVYPGATEQVCVPILEAQSGLSFNQDFVCGYSPERINPGDRNHSLTSIVKVTSGSTPDSAKWIDSFYGSIIEAGTHSASSIQVAEAAKVIENTQRDLNIALINELAIIFHRLNIDTLDVLEAAGTKWNFLPFRPGLVGGHCIGVDPYYLTHKAEQLGYHPEVVLAGRRINDRMSDWIVERVILEMARSKVSIGGSSVLIMGLTFKENCPDLRNTKVIDMVRSFQRYAIKTIVDDPWASKAEALSQYGISLNSIKLSQVESDVVVIAVAHEQFKSMSVDDWRLIARNKLIFDIKGIVPRELNPIRL